MGIITWKTTKLFFCTGDMGFIYIYLRGVHLNPHAKCRSPKFNLKLFKKEKRG